MIGSDCLIAALLRNWTDDILGDLIRSNSGVAPLCADRRYDEALRFLGHGGQVLWIDIPPGGSFIRSNQPDPIPCNYRSFRVKDESSINEFLAENGDRISKDGYFIGPEPRPQNRKAFFHGFPPQNRLERFLQYPLEDQYKIFTYGVDCIEPPQMIFAGPMAERGAAAVPLLLPHRNSETESGKPGS